MTIENNEDLLNIVQSAPIGICILDAATLITEMVNDAFLKVAGKPYDAIYGKYHWDSFAEAAPFYAEALSNVVKTGITYRADEVEMMLIRQGKEEWVFVTFVYEPVKDKNGVVQKVSIWVLENTVQVNARREIQKLNEELATSNEEIRATNEELGVTIERLSQTEEQLQVLNEELTAGNEELSATNEDLAAATEELRASNEELVDIQYRLEQSKLLLDTAIEAGGVGTYIIDQKTGTLTASPRLKELFGYYPDEEMPYEAAITQITSDHRERVVKAVEAAFAEGKPFFEEYTILGYRDGRLRWVRSLGKTDTSFIDGAVYFSGAIVDITEQVDARNVQQRTNDGLNAANEELSSTNEELSASNDELRQSRMDLVELNRKVSESEERFRNMAESTEVFIGISDESGNAIYFNKIWSETTGRDNKELLEFGWADLVHPDDIARTMHNYSEAIESHGPFTNEFRVLTKEGDYIWLFVQGIPRVHSNGSFAGHIGSAFDITERKKDDQRKSDFIGMVSHEMKTPLTSLSAYLQVLQMMAKSEQGNPTLAMLDRAYSQVGRMTKLINGFLNVARLESGKIQIDKTRFDLAQLVKEAEEDVQSTIKSHRIIFHPVEEVWVDADHDKIGQVITNLISNAVKYSSSDTEIVVSCFTLNGCATISVKDKGMGIKEEDQLRLFERYYRVNHDITTAPSGFGIGLYLCAEIIQRHDGKIWVESDVNKGSTFSFSLPVVS